MSSESEERTSIIPMPGGASLPEWWTRVAGPVPFLSSIPFRTDEQSRRMLFEHLAGECVSADVLVNTTIAATNYTLVPASKASEDGETSEWVRCVIQLEDGRRVAFGSRGVLQSLASIELLCRRAPWSPPLRLRLKSRPLNNGHRWLTLEPEWDDSHAVVQATRPRKG